jgi:tetratricopeptide (TPR) repeat protein
VTWIARFLGRHPKSVIAVVAVGLAASMWAATDYVDTVVRPREAEARQARIESELARADSLFGRDKFVEALSEYRYLLDAFAADLAPAMAGRLHRGIGLCHVRLAAAGDTRKNLEDAVAAFEQALALQEAAADPAGYAGTEYLIGDAWRALAAAEGDPALLDRAVEAYQAGMAVLSPDDDVDAYVAGLRSIGNVHRDLYAADPRQNPIQDAMDLYDEALRRANPLTHPVARGDTLLEIGQAYVLQSEHGYVQRNLDEAIETYDKALDIYTAEAFPHQHALVHKLLGDAYTRITKTEPRNPNERASHQQRVIRAQNRARASYQIARSFGLAPEFEAADASDAPAPAADAGKSK